MSLYTLEVFLTEGPITSQFVKNNRVVSRTIEIRGDQTLDDLHRAVFTAFDREEEHLYEFQIGGEGPDDPRAKRYGLPVEVGEGLEDDEMDGNASTTTLDALKLQQDQPFGYCFDFGDDWRHQINVLSVKKKTPKGEYPKVVKRVGESPPQYAEESEEPEEEPMIWILRVELVFGMHAEGKCARVLEIESSATLDELHMAIQDAVDFDNDHLYEFYVAKNARSRDKLTFDDENGRIFSTTLEDLYPLEKGKTLYYMFDYGDSWLFKISKGRKKPHPPEEGVEYPRLVQKIGDDPEQYPDWEE
ncbi:MAG: hypothetical protein V1792_23900 [Pseudomonadota bacterium]